VSGAQAYRTPPLNQLASNLPRSPTIVGTSHCIRFTRPVSAKVPLRTRADHASTDRSPGFAIGHFRFGRSRPESEIISISASSVRGGQEHRPVVGDPARFQLQRNALIAGNVFKIVSSRTVSADRHDDSSAVRTFLFIGNHNPQGGPANRLILRHYSYGSILIVVSSSVLSYSFGSTMPCWCDTALLITITDSTLITLKEQYLTQTFVARFLGKGCV